MKFTKKNPNPYNLKPGQKVRIAPGRVRSNKISLIAIEDAVVKQLYSYDSYNWDVSINVNGSCYRVGIDCLIPFTKSDYEVF